MNLIPDRENLESMSRIDIQKLCKVNNIKANMRTDEMINALCDQVNGKDVPRPHRSISERVASQPLRSRLSSVQPPVSNTTEVSGKKPALQPSESNTDAEFVAEMPASAPTTRRKAKDLQLHLGKGRPVIAGGSGARNITKVLSRGSGRRTKASAMLQEDPIPEEEAIVSKEIPDNNDTGSSSKHNDTRPSSVRPLSPFQGVSTGLLEEQTSHLPTPASSHLSWPSAQFTALESRVNHLETPNLDARLSLLEAAMSDIATLKTSVTQISVLQEEIMRLEDAQKNVKAEVAEWIKMHTELKNRTVSLEVHVKGLVVENGALKEQVEELEEKLRHHEDTPGDDVSMSSVVIHSPSRPQELKTTKADKGVSAVVANLDKRAVLLDDLPNPSPSQPTLGKRARSETETPDVSLTDLATNDGSQKQRGDAELEAIHRVIRPQKKKQRLDFDIHENTLPFHVFQDGPGGPSSTSTPQQHRSVPLSGFFTGGRPAPTPLPRIDGDVFLRTDTDQSSMEGAGASRPNAIAGPSTHRVTSSLEAPCTPPSQTAGGMPLAVADSGRVNVYDPAFFSGPPPVLFPQSSHLPFPLVSQARRASLPVSSDEAAPSTARARTPSTPNAQDAQDILERSARFAQPSLGEPWRFEATVTPSQRGGDSTGEPATPGDEQSEPSSSAAGASGSSRTYTFRAGGRRERNDPYHPFFTPTRGSSTSPRTGITPGRGFSFSLRSPPAMETVPEVTEPPSTELDEDGVVRSPPSLKTLYGTELEGDTRFGDYGKELGRFTWRSLLPG